jgi:hypothetical protein
VSAIGAAKAYAIAGRMQQVIVTAGRTDCLANKSMQATQNARQPDVEVLRVV